MEAWDVEGVWGLSPCLLANVHAGTDPWAKALSRRSLSLINFRLRNRRAIPDYAGTDP